MLKQFSTGSLSLYCTVSVLLLSGCGGTGSSDGGSLSIGLTKAELGRQLFIDESLSGGGNQSCATCHDLSNSATSGFADPVVTKSAPVSVGSDGTSFGNRNAPTASYASFIPPFQTLAAAGVAQSGETDSKYRGGQFLDGRAIDLTEQAKGPFLNPVEMNNVDKLDVVTKVSNAAYATYFKTIYGADSFDGNRTDETYDNIADAIAAFEKTSELNAFTSRFDDYIRNKIANPLTAQELRGLALFKDTTKAKCANCHTLDDSNGAVPSDSLFTNFEYYNIGVPVNLNTPTSLTVDKGLGSGENLMVDSADITSGTEDGKFRVPTLRNVALTAPYMHNGVHATLEDVINHYDLFGDGNIFAEVTDNIATEMNEGNGPIGLQAQDVADIKAFLLTLSDQ